MYPGARPHAGAVSYLFASPHYAGTDDDDSLFGAEHKPLRTKGERVPISDRDPDFDQAVLDGIADAVNASDYLDDRNDPYVISAKYSDGGLTFVATIVFVADPEQLHRAALGFHGQ